MYVFYYVINGKIYFTCCRGAMPSKLSPIWESPSACAWLVPGSNREDEETAL